MSSICTKAYLNRSTFLHLFELDTPPVTFYKDYELFIHSFEDFNISTIQGWDNIQVKINNVGTCHQCNDVSDK